MSTITIPAAEICGGDILDLGGQPLEIVKTEDTGDHMVLWIDSRYGLLPLDFVPNLAFNVQRPTPPDPDAELVDVMARELARVEREAGLAIEWERLTDEGGRRLYRDQARAALAAAREWVVAS